MNERAIFAIPVQRIAEKGTTDEPTSASQFTEDGGDNRRTPIAIEAERAARSAIGGYTTRAWAYYQYGVRCCRSIIARHDWVRLEESLSQQYESVAAFSENAPDRAVFEWHEPAVVIDMRLMVK